MRTPNNPAKTQRKRMNARPAMSQITSSSPSRVRVPDRSSIVLSQRPKRGFCDKALERHRKPL